MLIIGAGGVTLQLIDELENQYGNELIFWVSEENLINSFLINKNFIIGWESLKDYFLNTDRYYILSVGGVRNRRMLLERLNELGGKSVSFISSSALISPYARINESVLIFPKVTIEPHVHIEKNSLINTGAIITHESHICELCEIGPGAVILGGVNLEPEVFIGANATVLPRIKIGKGASIGAGAVVTKNILPKEIVIGVPARPINKK